MRIREWEKSSNKKYANINHDGNGGIKNIIREKVKMGETRKKINKQAEERPK